MLRTLPLTRKLIALGLIGLCSTLVAGVAGYKGLTEIASIARQLDGAVGIQRAHMDAQMRHNGLRAVVATARVDAIRGKTGDAIIAETVQKGATLLAVIDSLRTTATDSVIRQATTAIRPQVQGYVTLAATIATTAFTKRGVAQSQWDEFAASFRALETGMENLGDKVEASTSALSSLAADTVRTSIWWLFWICAISLLIVAGTSTVIVRAIRAPIM